MPYPKTKQDLSVEKTMDLPAHGRKTKLTQEQADVLREDYKAGSHPFDLAKKYGVSVPMVWKILQGVCYSGKPSTRWLATENPMPPDRVREIAVKYAKTMGIDPGYTYMPRIVVDRIAERIGIGPRSMQSYLQAEGSKGYRRPSGPVVKLLEELEWSLGIRHKKDQA